MKCYCHKGFSSANMDRLSSKMTTADLFPGPLISIATCFCNFSFQTKPWFLLQKSVPAVTYSLDGDTLLRIDGQTRESVCEVLFEQDNDCISVSTMILDALLLCPIDTRYESALIIYAGPINGAGKMNLARLMFYFRKKVMVLRCIDNTTLGMRSLTMLNEAIS